MLCEADECGSLDDVPRFLCLSCDSTYCDVCWGRQGPHKPGKAGIDGLPHERTEKAIYERLKVILDPPSSVQELNQLHLEDEDTTWFGIEKDSSGQPIFQDHGRYAALMSETRQPGSPVRYPQLVSFVGQTGAGKSTLIKMLVSLKERKLTLGSGVQFKSPVVGSIKNDKSPTSGDVHLYADPETAYGPLPMLYADCEGLEGGEIAPTATKVRNQGHAAQVRKRLFSTRPRELVYARTNSDARNREWAVRKVYPRLLYTFSDVIVFVLRNTRTFESSALRLLIDWASTSLESSINQPTLPHAIMVLNATSTEIDPEEWDIRTATDRLMTHVENAVLEVPFFMQYAEHWRRKHKPINTMLDLIRCYYASICVVRVPTKGRYMLADTQINQLHAEIVKSCDTSFMTKSNAHMLSNTDELNSYLQAGFDHFTTEEVKPFNFVEVALKNNPIPRDFGDHILGLAAEVRVVTRDRNGPNLFAKLSYMVASCIFIDCIRQNRPGKSQDLFGHFYSSSCVAALEHFCNKFWPCSYVSKKEKACVNVKATHSIKGHQTAEGKIISSGPYQSHFSPFRYNSTWTTLIKNHLSRFEKELEEESGKRQPRLGSAPEPTDTMAFNLHHAHMQTFFRSWENLSARHFSSPTTCFCCLMEVPQHPLPCGHVLCTACIKVYGKRNDRNSVLMEHCPLHTGEAKFAEVWVIHFKPDFAGVRVLTLDGGGIRGIVELEVLRAIEQALGGRIPLIAFFDLIVGTSTGGIIALGMGVKQWTLDQCVSEFVRLCDQAFTPRELQAPGLKQVTTLAHGSKYKTKPLRDALRNVFGDEHLYGGPKKGHTVYDTKVAVTATSGTGAKAILLANYSRQEENEPNYKFEFPHRLGLWEAASATSAAPPFFKPFESQTRRTYLDGAIYYNNPIKVANHERKYIWPDVAENPPDIILSIGTGKNGSSIDIELQKEKNEPSSIRESKPKSSSLWNRLGQKFQPKAKKPKHFQLISKYFDVLVNRLDKILDAEREWQVFCSEPQDIGKTKDTRARCIRVNLDLKQDPPSLDNKQELSNLQTKVVQLLRTRPYRAEIDKIAHRLLASTFYFIKESIGAKEDGTFHCSGRITCRFESNTAEMRGNMRELGVLLRHQQTPGYQPYFTIKEQPDDPDSNKVYITEDMIEDMVRRAEFRFDELVDIQIPTQLSTTTIYLALYERRSFDPEIYPISGFPRCLIMEDTVNATRLDKRAELIRRRRYGALDVANDPKVISHSEEDLAHAEPTGTDPAEGTTLAESTSSEGGTQIDSSTNGIHNAKGAESTKSLATRSKSQRAPQSKPSEAKNAQSTQEHAENGRGAIMLHREHPLRRRPRLDSRPEAQNGQGSSPPSSAGVRPSESTTLVKVASLGSLRSRAQVEAGQEVVVVDAMQATASQLGGTSVKNDGWIALAEDSDGPPSDEDFDEAQ